MRSLLIYALMMMRSGLADTRCSDPYPAKAVATSWHTWHNATSTNILDIGTALTLDKSTKYGSIGNQLKQAYTLYFNWLNDRKGGLVVGGVKYWVRLHLIDDASDGDMVENITKHLVNDRKIMHFLGPYGSTLVGRAAAVLHDAGAVMVCGCAASTSVFRNRPRMFGVLSTSSTFLTHAMSAVQNPTASTVAYVYEDQPFTRGVCGQVQALASQHGLSVVFGSNNEGKFTHDAAGIVVRQLLSSIANTKPDVLIGCVYANVCKAILETLVDLKINPKAIILTVCVTMNDFRTINGDRSGYVMGVAPWTREVRINSQLTDLDVDSFVALFESTYGVSPTYQAAASFASAATLSYAIQQAGTVTNASKVADVLRTLDRASVFGRIAFDSNGQGKNPIKVLQVQGPQTQVIAPTSVSSASLLYPKPTFDALTCMNSDPHNVGFHGIAANGSCLPCNSTEIAPYNPSLGYRICQKMTCNPGYESVIFQPSVNGSSTGGAYCAICSQGHFAPTFGVSQCEACQRGKYYDGFGATACIACSPGKRASRTGSVECLPCVTGRYSSNAGSSQCLTCPKGSRCIPNRDGVIVNYTNDDGYFLFRHNSGSQELIRCQHGKNGNACVAGGKCYVVSGTLEQSMEGPFCGRCRKGYGRRSSSAVCQKCPSMFMTMLLVMLQCILLVSLSGGVFAMIVWTDLSKPKNFVAVILKQMLNYLDMTSAVLEVTELRFPISFGVLGGVLDFFRILFGNSSPEIVSLANNCLAEKIWDPYKIYLILGLIWVPVWMLVLTALFAAYHRIQKNRRVTPPKHSRLMTLIIVNLFIVHPRNNELCLSVFRCKHFDQPRMMMDTTVDCQSAAHREWKVPGLVGLGLYSLGIPVGIYMLLKYYKAKGKLQQKKTISSLGFLYSGFEPQHFYFESIFMLRKVLYHLIVVFPALSARNETEDKTMKCMSMCLLAVIFLALHMVCEPYDNRSYFALDRIEGASLWAILITLLVQTWVYVSDNAYAFNSGLNGDPDSTRRNKDIRDGVGAFVVALFHIRFFWRVFFVSIRPTLSEATRLKVFDHGYVEVHERGLQLHEEDNLGGKLFSTMFQELTLVLVESRNAVYYDELIIALQYMTANTAYHRAKDLYDGGWHEDDEDDDFTHLSLMANMRSRENLEMMLQRCAHIFRTQFVEKIQKYMDQTQNVVGGVLDSDTAVRKKKRTMEEKRREEKLEKMKVFTAEAVLACNGKKFAVEELHMSMVRISRDMTRFERPRDIGTGKLGWQGAFTSGRRQRTKTRTTSRPSESWTNKSTNWETKSRNLVNKLMKQTTMSDRSQASGLEIFRFDGEGLPPNLEEADILERNLRNAKAQLALLQQRHEQVLKQHEHDILRNELKIVRLQKKIHDAHRSDDDSSSSEDLNEVLDTSGREERYRELRHELALEKPSHSQLSGQISLVRCLSNVTEVEGALTKIAMVGLPSEDSDSPVPSRKYTSRTEFISVTNTSFTFSADDLACKKCGSTFMGDANFCRICGEPRSHHFGDFPVVTEFKKTHEDHVVALEKKKKDIRRALGKKQADCDFLEDATFKLEIEMGIAKTAIQQKASLLKKAEDGLAVLQARYRSYQESMQQKTAREVHEHRILQEGCETESEGLVMEVNKFLARPSPEKIIVNV